MTGTGSSSPVAPKGTWWRRVSWWAVSTGLILILVGIVIFFCVGDVSSGPWQVALVILCVLLLSAGGYFVLNLKPKSVKGWLGSLFATVGPVLGVVLGLGSLLWEKEEPEASLDTCLEAIEAPPDSAAALVDDLFCRTEYANIWQPDPPTMFTDNKELAADNFGRYVDLTNEHDFDGALGDGAHHLTSIYTRWPQFQDRKFVVGGSPTGMGQLTHSEEFSEWSLQLGTKYDPNKVIYVRMRRPAEWSLEQDCQTALIEIIPIARGLVPSAGGAGPLEVIYGLETSLLCLPMPEEDVLESAESLRSLAPKDR